MLVVCEKVKGLLEQGTIVNDMGLNEEELEDIRDLHLLTNKKFVYACNVSEDMMDTSEDELKKLIGITSDETRVVPVCAKLEEDMVEMSADEKHEFLSEMGLVSTGLDNLIKASYDALGLEYYFTA
jgi:ribosome-binding ATPase YchF (GTP1/OBG family)